MISYSNDGTRGFMLSPINMDIAGMKGLAEQFFSYSLQLEFFPERKKRGLDEGFNLINKSAMIKQKIIDLHNQNSPNQINMDTHDIVVSPKPNMELRYGDRDTIEAMSRILLHARYVGTRKCWIKYQEKHPEK